MSGPGGAGRGEVVQERSGNKRILRLHWDGLGPRRESCFEAGQRGGRDWIPSGICYLGGTCYPKNGGQCFLSPARQGWGLAREGRWRCLGRRNSFHFPAGCRERVPGVGERGCQDAEPRGIRIARCSPFMGLS